MTGWSLASALSPCWMYVWVWLLQIRGPLYMKDHKKEASGPALYELVDFDFYCSENRVVHIASLRTDLPKVRGCAVWPCSRGVGARA